MSAALILAGEGDQEILKAGGFQPRRRLHDVVVALASDHPPRCEDDAGVRPRAKGVADTRDALGRDAGRIESICVEAERQRRDLRARGWVAVADEIGEVFARGDDAVAAHHHAVIETLEVVLFAEALEPSRDEGTPLSARCEIGAPYRCAAEREDDVAMALRDQQR